MKHRKAQGGENRTLRLGRGRRKRPVRRTSLAAYATLKPGGSGDRPAEDNSEAPRAAQPGSRGPYVFLSYTSSDRARVLALADRLGAAGIRV